LGQLFDETCTAYHQDGGFIFFVKIDYVCSAVYNVSPPIQGGSLLPSSQQQKRRKKKIDASQAKDKKCCTTSTLVHITGE